MVRILFTILLLLHGLIHLLGFAKAFKFAEISQLTQAISKPTGAFWGLAALLFTIGSILFVLKKDSWWIWAIPALLISQILIFGSWQDAKFGTIANILVLIGAIIGFGTTHYFNTYQNEVKSGLERTTSIAEALVTEADLQRLPLPVQNYLRYVDAVGKPKVQNFKVEFDGKIRKNEQSEWMPFTSEQYNFMDVPTRLFFMKAKMKGLPIAGFHAFKNGEAFMDIRLLSLAKVQYQTGKEMGISETVTFFNDMCCMAPATLIDPRIQWLETDGNKVKAAFTNNGITISAWLYFNDAGQLGNFISNDRYAAGDDNTMQQLPWATPLKNYKNINGHQLPGFAETIYSYPAGDLVYGTFNTMHVEYNCATNQFPKK
ncbi:MAG: hypothetical protein IPN76_23230 [Saprospiraceae bacterium]|nr:hypothetical protein [Saprospiraceae bacterium]